MSNPYTAPNAVLSEPADETYEPSLFAINGRIGRIRYLAYSFVSTFVLLFVLGIVAAIVIPMFMNEGAVYALMALIYVPSIALMFILARRRLNDLDHSGWWSLLLFVPFVNLLCVLYLLFGPGSAGTNDYGPKPVKNSTLLVVGGVVAPILFAVFIGILAAIAIPQYEAYVERAKAAGASSSQPGR